jgi:hypothetical protein
MSMSLSSSDVSLIHSQIAQSCATSAFHCVVAVSRPHLLYPGLTDENCREIFLAKGPSTRMRFPVRRVRISVQFAANRMAIRFSVFVFQKIKLCPS